MSTEANEISTKYDPKQVEDKWYQKWEEQNYFAPRKEGKESFSIVMPPPNVTGQLHMGHALDNTLQDILTRWKRLKGYDTLWLPGTDHAGIATQAKVEEKLAAENVSKYDIGREKFLAEVWSWKEKYHERISRQLRQMGTSCDWSRERFTMDEGCSKAVREVFVKLYEKGLIYKGKYIVNWCPKCHTTISDIEVEHDEHEGKIYHLKYPLQDGSGFIMVATTRPETILGDTAVAVNPEDERYTQLVGKKVIVPVIEREIPIIADEYVDPAFGTGAVKITPSHDPNDFEVGLRHQLPQITVIDKDACMNKEAGPYIGLDRYECRQRIIEDFDKKGLLVKIEDHVHAVGQCYRCGTVIEPLISPQWFVKMQTLAEPALKAVDDGKIRFVPERFTKVYRNWLEEIKDWCISRQLWWGHRIPVWYCEDCKEIICSVEAPESCPSCGSDCLKQDEDVLDTWFSSGLWPFSTLGWPEDNNDLNRYYPTSVLVTGRDIIFFWVARMIFMGLEFMDQEPFQEVFIHGLVLDNQGRKMSKSLGNGIDPLEIIENYGADTLRFMLVTGNTPGNDLKFQEERLEAARNFANKIWNASRFVMMNLTDFEVKSGTVNLTLADKWILENFQKTVVDVDRLLEKYELGEAAREIYDFIWNSFCDWYIELIKPRLYGQNVADRYTAQYVASHVLRGSMELLHPFMPFITEEIWQHLPHEGETIMYAKWPTLCTEYESYSMEANKMDLLMEFVKAVRNIRGEMKVPLGQKIEIVFLAEKEIAKDILEGKEYLENLAGANKITVKSLGMSQPDKAAAAVVKGTEIFVPLEGIIDLEQETARISKEIGKMDKELARLDGKLNNSKFIANAPQDVIEKEKAKKSEYGQKREALLERLEMLKG